MIEETQKKGNSDFGRAIIDLAMEVKNKKDHKKGNKDFVSQHTKVVKNWQENRNEKIIDRKLEQERKLSEARSRKNELL